MSSKEEGLTNQEVTGRVGDLASGREKGESFSRLLLFVFSEEGARSV